VNDGRHYALPAPLAEALVAYLVRQPYEDVFKLIADLQRMEEIGPAENDGDVSAPVTARDG
jgi:hypothetical protein